VAVKRVLAALSAFALLQFATQAAQAQDDIRVFKPATAWAADYGDDYCRLARDFTDGKSTLSLAMDRVQPTNSVRVIVMGDVKTFRSANQVGYSLLPSGGGERKGPFWQAASADGRDYLNLGEMTIGPPFAFDAGAAKPPAPEPDKPIAIPPYDRAAEQQYAAGITSIALTSGVSEPLRIETGNLKAPMTALQKCTDDLLGVWGLDAPKHQTMTRPVQPATDASKWVPNGTIGFDDFGKLGGSSNQIRVMVSADGKATACAVHWTSLDQKTNDALCKAILSKGSFFPALDKDGQPMASYWTVAPFAFMPPMPGFGR
jgi:hypothetical protein